MGTLYDQPERSYEHNSQEYLELIADDVDFIVKSRGYSIDQAIQLIKLSEMSRASDLVVQDGNIKDEQLAGFGELLKQLVDHISR